MQRLNKTLLKPRRLQVNQTIRRILMQDKLHHLFFPLASPEYPAALSREAENCQCLGITRDGCRILLLDNQADSLLLREIGRLRELAFRRVGEGTGRTRDLDAFDSHYHHLVLWDGNACRIAGAYRLGNGQRILAHHGLRGFYTASLYQYRDTMLPYLSAGLELGRSFVHPDYQGKASLDYLWQGIGAYLSRFPEIRYLVGPVSISARIPSSLVTELVWYYRQWFYRDTGLSRARSPFIISSTTSEQMNKLYGHLEKEAAFTLLERRFAEKKLKVPVLFRQYTALFESSGFSALDFSIDPSFGDCVDVLCMADLNCLKARKRKRYIPVPDIENVPPRLSCFQTEPAPPLDSHKLLKEA